MTLPYSNTTAGDKALSDIQKTLRNFGCNKFGSFIDDEAGELMVQFEFRGRMATIKASINGYAAMWLKENPHTSRMRSSKTEHERKARDVASVAVYSILRDYIKAQVMIIETGVLSFEGAFLGSIMLPSGKTVLEQATESNFLPRLESKQ